MTGDPISKKTLARLPLYLGYLREQKGGDQPYISATTIADALGLNQVQVRKDLALISSGGKPKVGYRISELEADIERFLGYDNINSAVIVGAGHLGKALMSYVGFKQYGLEIIAAFDSDPSLWNTAFNGITVFPPEKMADIAERLKLHIGIITVPTRRRSATGSSRPACARSGTLRRRCCACPRAFWCRTKTWRPRWRCCATISRSG